MICKKHGAPISYTEKDCPACVQIKIMEEEATLSLKAMRQAKVEIQRLKTGLEKEAERTLALTILARQDGLSEGADAIHHLQADLADAQEGLTAAYMTGVADGKDKQKADLALSRRVIAKLGSWLGQAGCPPWGIRINVPGLSQVHCDMWPKCCGKTDKFTVCWLACARSKAAAEGKDGK